MKQSSIRREISRVNQSISGNKKFQEFVADMKLLVRTDEGQCITVTKDNIVGLNDAIDLLVAKKKILSCELAEVVSKMEKILREREKENGQLSFFESESVAAAFDKRIVSIPMNQIVIKKEIEKIEKELLKIGITDIQINQDGYINSLYWLKVKHPNANKGDAITFIKNHVACDYTVSFGNETNDIEMFLASDISICVANAYNVIKDIADYGKISITIADDILELFEKEYHRYLENNKQV